MFEFTESQERLRADVRSLLASPVVQAESGGTRHARRTYELLGDNGWLAVQWPTEYGGQAAGWVESAIVAEEIALAGVPDSARINTIDNIGSTVLAVGTEQQRAEYLLPMARGRMLGCVLFSEPGVGSDLAALRTTATETAQGWRLTGTKTWTVGADWADVGVCAARTGTSKYADISLFLVSMRADGVRVEAVPGINPESFNQVALDVDLPPEALLGAVGQGWQLVNNALGLERTGIPFWGRARRWLDLVSSVDDSERVRELDAELAAARLLAWRCVGLLSHGLSDGDFLPAAAAAKWWASELAGEVARLAWEVLPPERSAPIVREAPGLTLAAGTSEMMLATLWSTMTDEVST